MSKTIAAEEPVNILFKTGILVTLCMQNAGNALLTRFSQGVMKEKYSSTGLTKLLYLQHYPHCNLS